MSGNAVTAINALNRRYLLDYPREAAQQLESLPAQEAAALIRGYGGGVALGVWNHLSLDVAEQLLPHLSDSLIRFVLSESEPARSASLLNRVAPENKDQYLSLLDPHIASELRGLCQYSPDTAGALMDPRVLSFRADTSVGQALARLRSASQRATREVYLVDDQERLDGRIELEELALAEAQHRLGDLARPVVTAVQDLSSRDEAVKKFEQFKLGNLPVIDYSGRLVGVIRQTALVAALQEEVSLDIQTMVGVSKDERALSRIPFAVTKRLPWLQINLLTAFLAASVVGLFESTIAQFTALAVLLPVVAGQSGNTGAQALAVTMRGLALREITLRHWRKVVFKEINVGLLNGVAIALTTGIGVYLWSRSTGLALVIVLSMVISMIAAGLAGALIPILLTRLGQDPAQSSSIILTTVTDVVGFFSFLGIATLLATLL